MAQLALPLDLPESSPSRPELRPRPARPAEESQPFLQLDSATSQRQLDLFANPQRHYLRAVRCLEELDTAGCRAALNTHRETCSDGPDPRPVAEAAAWLDREIPGPGEDLGGYGSRCLALCRCLREGGSLPPLLALHSGLRAACAAAVARRALARAQQAGVSAQHLLNAGLPWAVLQLVVGDLDPARHGLHSFLTNAPASSGAWLALAETYAGLGKDREAACALREGHGLDPDGTSWGPIGARTAQLRDGYRGDSLFDGDWWVVGAYLEEKLPRYAGSGSARVAERRRRFAELCQAQAPTPVRFFAGLFLSEQAALLPHPELVTVRRTLRELHPEAYRVHMEQLEELGPPAEQPGGGGLAG